MASQVFKVGHTKGWGIVYVHFLLIFPIHMVGLATFSFNLLIFQSRPLYFMGEFDHVSGLIIGPHSLRAS
jgi:hypothetical protein